MKKVFSFIMIFVLTLAAITIPVNAAGEGIYLSADKTSVKPGETVTISIMLVSGTELIGGDFQINYDKGKFEYTSEANGDTGLIISTSRGDGYVKASCMGTTPASNTKVYSFTFTALSSSGVGTFELSAPNGITVGSNYTDMNSGFTVEGIDVTVKLFATNTTATVGTTSTEFNITITDCPASGIIYVGIYDGTVLKGCGLKKFTSAITSEKITVDNVTGGTFKVFIWGEDGTPLLETPEVKSLN